MIRFEMIEGHCEALSQSFVCRGLRAIERAADVVHDGAQIRLDPGIEARAPTKLVMERVEQVAQTLFGHILGAAFVASSSIPAAPAAAQAAVLPPLRRLGTDTRNAAA